MVAPPTPSPSRLVLPDKCRPTGNFRFDPANAQLWNGAQEIPLRPQAFALLRYLPEHASRLVTKKELFEQIWATRMAAKGISGFASGRYAKLSGIRREPRGSFRRSTVGDIDLSPRLPLPHQLLTPQLPILSGEKRNWYNCTDFWETPFKARAPPKAYRIFSHPSSW